MPNENSRSTDIDEREEFIALQKTITALTPFTQEVRRRILNAAATFLRIESPVRLGMASRGSQSSTSTAEAIKTSPFSEDTSMTPKQFLNEKQPKTDVERIACLAYYLTHYRGTPHFKTVDLSILNTEAAQPKFANTAYSANNAVKQGYLVPSVKGQRQLSAIGEQFVRALPDRDAAKVVLKLQRRKRRSKSNNKKLRTRDR